MSFLAEPIRVAIDGNEGNVDNRVGSNVYAFELISAMEKLTFRRRKEFEITVLLSAPPIADWPKERLGWHYEVITPTQLWTQWAAPLYLARYPRKFEVFFSPGHYVPRNCPLPYVSSIMDLAFLHFPDQFKKRDLWQLEHWTKKAVKKAAKIITISQFSRHEIIKAYGRNGDDIIVAPPGVFLSPSCLTTRQENSALASLEIGNKFFLYLGTLQPRKNLLRVIEAFENLVDDQERSDLQLVLAGKIGWLADEILLRAKNSPIADQIILTGFISENLKPTLYRRCLANLNLGLYEGFGIPALEGLAMNSLPIVANNTSLPEVVGPAGLAVDPYDVTEITKAMATALKITPHQHQQWQKIAEKQLHKFSYDQSANLVLSTLRKVVGR